MARTTLDKETRTERYARCNTPAKRRRDLSVKFRCSYSDGDDVYTFGPRDDSFWAAHKWTDEDVRELINARLEQEDPDFFNPFDYDPDPYGWLEEMEELKEIAARRTREREALVELRSAEADNSNTARTVKKRVRTRASRASRAKKATPVSPKLQVKLKPRPVIEQSILPKHLRDPECAPRRR